MSRAVMITFAFRPDPDVDPETWSEKHLPIPMPLTGGEDQEWGSTYTYGAILEDDDWELVKAAWTLDLEDCTPGLGILWDNGQHFPADDPDDPDCGVYTIDGMDWNIGGVTPLFYVDVYVSVPLFEAVPA